MTDFFDRFEQQLVLAEQRLAPAPPPRRRSSGRRRLGLAAIAVVLVAGPASAAVQPWNIVFGRADVGDTPSAPATTPVPADEASVLGLLRREQTDADRGARAQRLVRDVGVEFRGVRADSVRVATAGSRTVAVLSAERVGDPAGRDGGGLQQVVCFTDGETGTCGDAKTLMAGKLTSYGGPQVLGLVPDGVATVVLRYAGGAKVSATVGDNLFSASGAPTTAATGASPAASQTPSGVDWLDAQGRRVGPG